METPAEGYSSLMSNHSGRDAVQELRFRLRREHRRAEILGHLVEVLEIEQALELLEASLPTDATDV